MLKRWLASPLLHQFLRFAAVGLFGTLVQYVCLWIGTEWQGKSAAAISSAIGYALGTVLNYALNYRFTFQSNQSHREAAGKYFSVLGIGWCINTSLMTLFVHHWHWQPWPSQILTTGIGLMWNFSGSRLWAFRHRSKDGA